MRAFDETRTLPRPRPKTTITFSRAPGAEGPDADQPGIDSSLRKHASTAAGDLAATAVGEAIAETSGERMAIASTIKIKAALDPARFQKLSRDISGESFSFAVAAANCLALKVTLSAKTARKAHVAIEQHGSANVSLMLTGRLSPNNAVLNPGLAVNLKAQKA